MKVRKDRAAAAKETLEILQNGGYQTGETVVDLSENIAAAVRSSVLYAPNDFEAVLRQREKIVETGRPAFSTRFQVINETTLSAAERLVRSDGRRRVLALNFASAKNPGGGFLRGSQAQEESLARSSALYPCLTKHESTMYKHNRAHPMDGFYSDHMVLSPNVPVFRKDNGQILAEPYLVSFLTAPAVNAGVVRKNTIHQVDEIWTTMLQRMEKILSVALVNGYDTLVLGGWGCGVFGNSPFDVTEQFAFWLKGYFAGRFHTVVFAILDNEREKVIRPFREAFES